MKKTPNKSPSYSNRKSAMKKGALNFRTVATESDIDKENDGVIIRMKNEESYYDTRDKYQSQLPEVPLLAVLGTKRSHKSLLSQRAMDHRSLDIPEREGSADMRSESILLRDMSLPSADSEAICASQCGAGDDDSGEIDLEPKGDCDSVSDTRQLMRLISEGPQRIRWAETEEGKKIIAIKALSPELIKWQEAQFEVITSEASYYRSLEVLVNKIYKSPAMACVGERRPLSLHQQSQDISDTPFSPLPDPGTPGSTMSALQKHHLFSNILEIHICSGELLRALETRWRESPFIEDLSDILVEFCKEKLKPYVTYLRNQQYQTSTYNQLLTQPEFLRSLRSMESDVDCGMMNLCSLLLLPMQRLMRLKLLFSVVRKYTPPNYPVHGCDQALEAVEELLRQSSEQKVLMEQKEEIMKIINRLTFRKKTKSSIGNKPLLKEGEMRVSASGGKASKSLKSLAHLYLFEDQLIISQRKKPPLCLAVNGDKEMVEDMCPRSEVRFDYCAYQRPLFSGTLRPNAAGNCQFKLVLMKGQRGSAEYLCETESREALEEWQNAFSPGVNDWEQFEFNDVIVTSDYSPADPSELELKRGQILSIVKRLDDRKAVASTGNRVGEIILAHVQFVSSQQPSAGLSLDLDVSAD